MQDHCRSEKHLFLTEYQRSFVSSNDNLDQIERGQKSPKAADDDSIRVVNEDINRGVSKPVLKSPFSAQSHICPTPVKSSTLRKLQRNPEMYFLNHGLNSGRTGLKNIGNTCYLNSAMQVLFHNKFLKRFFLEREFELEINESNSLGSKGVLLRAIGNAFWEFYKVRSG